VRDGELYVNPVEEVRLFLLNLLLVYLQPVLLLLLLVVVPLLAASMFCVSRLASLFHCAVFIAL
jgi:hypothetical protein